MEKTCLWVVPKPLWTHTNKHPQISTVSEQRCNYLQVSEKKSFTEVVSRCGREKKALPLSLTPWRKQLRTEKECLAAVWPCEKFYITGLDKFRLHTVHEPLVPQMNTWDSKGIMQLQNVSLRNFPSRPNTLSRGHKHN